MGVTLPERKHTDGPTVVRGGNASGAGVISRCSMPVLLNRFAVYEPNVEEPLHLNFELLSIASPTNAWWPTPGLA